MFALHYSKGGFRWPTRANLLPIDRIGPMAPRDWLSMVGDSAGVPLRPQDGGDGAVGEIDGWTVRLQHRVGSVQLSVSCDTDGAIPRLFELAAEGIIQSADLRTGDDVFDRRVLLRGPDRVVAALMGRDQRARVLAMQEAGKLSVQGSVVTATVSRPRGGPDRTARLVRDVVALAQALAMRHDENGDRLLARVVDAAETPTLATTALEELASRWPGRVKEARSLLAEQGSAGLLSRLEELIEQRRRQERAAAGAGGELAVVDPGQAGALSEVRRGEVSLKKD